MPVIGLLYLHLLQASIRRHYGFGERMQVNDNHIDKAMWCCSIMPSSRTAVKVCAVDLLDGDAARRHSAENNGNRPECCREVCAFWRRAVLFNEQRSCRLRWKDARRRWSVFWRTSPGLLKPGGGLDSIVVWTNLDGNDSGQYRWALENSMRYIERSLFAATFCWRRLPPTLAVFCWWLRQHRLRRCCGENQGSTVPVEQVCRGTG